MAGFRCEFPNGCSKPVRRNSCGRRPPGREHSRDHLRYGSDLSDAEWLILAPFMPSPTRRVGPANWPMREIMNAIFDAPRAGCAWRLLPRVSPRSTVYGWFLRFRREGLFETINHYLVMADRERSGRQASPSAAVIDSQSVKTIEAGGPRGYDAGKKIKGRKRHAMVGNTPTGPARRSRPTPADVQLSLRRHSTAQGVAKVLPLRRTRLRRQRLCRPARQGRHLHRHRSGHQDRQPVGFQVLPRRWVVERFFAWINRNRRLAKDFEGTIASATTFLYAASVMLLTRRLARSA